ncbi:MAG TPA: hypothetical protein DCM38_12795 [Gammaproteobacteria bacterium]|nr:hypothetical protein [Gammaproteobacteria bacterium]
MMMSNDNIVIFHPEIVKDHEDYNSTGLDILYAAEEKHFWFLARKQRIINIFKKYVQTHESILVLEQEMFLVPCKR